MLDAVRRPIATEHGDLSRTHPVGCLTQLSPRGAGAVRTTCAFLEIHRRAATGMQMCVTSLGYRGQTREVLEIGASWAPDEVEGLPA